MVAWILRFVRQRSKRPRRRPTAASKANYQTHVETARALIHERLEVLNQHYGFKYYRVSIRNQASRWGSCSKQGNLNFNYRLALIPLPLVDYVIVHELCHLKELNHSTNFWNLVAQTIPDYKQRRAALKQIRLNTR